MLKDSFNTEIPDRKCHHCEHQGKPMRGRFNELHGYAFVCEQCERFLAWGGKNKAIMAEDKRQRSSQWTAHRLRIRSCQMCLREQDELGTREQLEVHHVQPVSQGGADQPDNLWVVCTACHRLIHWQQTYLNDHQKQRSAAWKSFQRFKKTNPEAYKKIHRSGDEDAK